MENLQQDTRITVLGHVQRGGNPSAFDRVLVCVMDITVILKDDLTKARCFTDNGAASGQCVSCCDRGMQYPAHHSTTEY